MPTPILNPLTASLAAAGVRVAEGETSAASAPPGAPQQQPPHAPTAPFSSLPVSPTPTLPSLPPPPPPPRSRRDRFTPYKERLARPAVYSPELITEIMENIERYGMEELVAARSCGVTPSTFARWKQEDPDLIEFIEDAKANFESAQLHLIEVFKRKDGQADPVNSRWMLKHFKPERYGTHSDRTKAGAGDSPRSEVSRGPAHAGKAAAKAAAQLKPGHPDFWARVDEEPLPRENLSTCTLTPGLRKFYSTLHLVSMPYRSDDDLSNPRPSIHPDSPEGKAVLEATYELQEQYFALPEHERLDFLHRTFEQQSGKVLTPEERAKADASAGHSSAPPLPQNQNTPPREQNVSERTPVARAAKTAAAAAQPETFNPAISSTPWTGPTPTPTRTPQSDPQSAEVAAAETPPAPTAPSSSLPSLPSLQLSPSPQSSAPAVAEPETPPLPQAKHSTTTCTIPMAPASNHAPTAPSSSLPLSQSPQSPQSPAPAPPRRRYPVCGPGNPNYERVQEQMRLDKLQDAAQHDPKAAALFHEHVRQQQERERRLADAVFRQSEEDFEREQENGPYDPFGPGNCF